MEIPIHVPRNVSPNTKLQNIITDCKNNNNFVEDNFAYYKDLNDNLKDKSILDSLNLISENVISYFPSPLSVITNLSINGHKNVIVPLSTEESSVIAALSNGCKFVGNIEAKASEPKIAGHIQFYVTFNEEAAKKIQLKAIKEKINKEMDIVFSQILQDINSSVCKSMYERGGGLISLRCDSVDDAESNLSLNDKREVAIYIIFELIAKTCDAMGANFINSALEFIAIELKDELTLWFNKEIEKENYQITTLARILTNNSSKRITTAKCFITPETIMKTKKISESEAINNMIKMYHIYKFAENHDYRAVTHNKGILNGIIAVATATGQDTRALASSILDYAKSKPLTQYSLIKNEYGKIEKLKITINVPTPIGLIGGSIKVNPIIKNNLELMYKSMNIDNKNWSVNILEEVLAAVGLAQNISAIYALSTFGIQYGHMKLHAKVIITQVIKINKAKLLSILNEEDIVHIEEQLIKIIEEQVKNNIPISFSSVTNKLNDLINSK